MLRTYLTALKNVLEVDLLILICLCALLVVLSNKGISGYRSYVIETGSMEPSIPAGSLIVTKTAEKYQAGEIITFYTVDANGTRERFPTTHRVEEIKDEVDFGYRTKGDANNTVDPIITPHSSVIGKVIFHIPYFGKFSNIVHTKSGLTYLIIIPMTILAYQQLLNIKEEIVKKLADRRNNSEPIKLN